MEGRGFPPFPTDVRWMAQTLVDRRGPKASKTVSKKWIYQFLPRSYNAQWAKNEDLKIIEDGLNEFSIRERPGILNEDRYNFDEIGFALGITNFGASNIAQQLV